MGKNNKKETNAPETSAEPVQETKPAEQKPQKLCKAVFLETVYSGLGIFQSGKSYEIPEKNFSAWTDAGICKKDEAK